MRKLFFFLTISLNAAAIKVPEGSAPPPRSSLDPFPYISYLTFQNRVSDFIIDEHTLWFDPDRVKRGDTIFLNFFFLQWFVDHVHDKIREPYILITCDKGGWAPHPNVKKILYDPKLAAWFCRNMVFSFHPKLFQIPMGQDLTLFNGSFPELIEAVEKLPLQKKHILYMNHLPRRHGDRDKIIEMFENAPFCFSAYRSGVWEPRPRPIYYEEMASSKFVLSPLGYETDCVRTWEAIALGCIPIVEHSFLDPLYEGLPIAIVHDWKEVDIHFLENKYNQSCEKAHFDYWQNLILDVKKKVIANENDFSSLPATQFKPCDLSDFGFILNHFVKDQRLIYKGFLSTLRPFQILKAYPKLFKMQLFDSWLDKEALQSFYSYVHDPLELSNMIQNSAKMDLLSSDSFNETIREMKSSVFLDLTYYRTSLYHEYFYNSVIEDRHFRHSLKKDLKEVFECLQPGVILFGNMRNERYVSEVLERFIKEIGHELGKKGDFWFIAKF